MFPDLSIRVDNNNDCTVPLSHKDSFRGSRWAVDQICQGSQTTAKNLLNYHEQGQSKGVKGHGVGAAGLTDRASARGRGFRFQSHASSLTVGPASCWPFHSRRSALQKACNGISNIRMESDVYLHGRDPEELIGCSYGRIHYGLPGPHDIPGSRATDDGR